MNYSRRDFLKFAAAGLSVAGMSANYSSAARAGTRTEGAYTQARANRIHNRSTEEAIKRAGEDPEEVKARVDRRLRALSANAAS